MKAPVSGLWSGSDLYVDFSEAVVQGAGVAQQQHSSVLRRLLGQGVEEPGDADVAQSLAAAGRQREVALRHPAQGHPGAVGGDAGQGVGPQPQVQVLRSCLGLFRCAGRWLFRLLVLLGPFLTEPDPAFKVVFVGGLLGAAAASAPAQELQVLGCRNTHHGVQLWFALGQQRQTRPHQAHPMGPEEGCGGRLVQRGRCPGTAPPLTFGGGGFAPTREQPQRLPVPGREEQTQKPFSS